MHTVCFLKGETSGFPSQTHPFPESLCVTPKWRVIPLIIAPAFVLRCNTGSITSGILTSHLAYCSTSVHPRNFCRFGFCSYRAKVHSHAVLRARTFAVLASVRDQTVIGLPSLQTNACRLHTRNTRKTSNRLQTAGCGVYPIKGVLSARPIKASVSRRDISLFLSYFFSREKLLFFAYFLFRKRK